MVATTWWSQHTQGSQRTAYLCRGARSWARSTAVRCFKSNSDESGSKQITALRLNFKIPYRVNFGQSLGLVGSGDSLGNWDPKRTVHMKWTDGDWWTVELTVAPGSSLDLEYKYVVMNSDGNIGYWKPGSNYRVTLPLPSGGKKVPKRVKVADAWDDSFKRVDVEESEVPTSVSSSGSSSIGNNGTAATSSGKPAGVQGGAAAAVQLPLQQAQSVGTSGGTAGVPTTSAAPAAAPSSTSSAPSTTTPFASEAPRPLAANAAAAPQGAQAAAAPAATAQGSAGVAQQPIPVGAMNGSGPVQTPQPSQTSQPTTQQATSPPSGAQPDTTKQSLGTGRNRAASPRSPPPSFAAATSIPVIHPSLMAEQERLEDGVKNSLEDLQQQMDRHQQLREKTDDPASPEIIVADRIVALANNKVIAYNKALKAVQEYNRLPPSANTAKDSANQEE